MQASDKASRAKSGQFVQNARMARGSPTPTDFYVAFSARVKAAREASGLSVKQMAGLLRVRSDTYSRYENRTPLKLHLIPTFARLAGVTVESLFTSPVRLQIVPQSSGSRRKTIKPLPAARRKKSDDLSE